uniref:Enoyl reductase (ER) domain-containing protein n=1 Tax=Parascaris univalens TaxID=6257 RepID=A0A915C452_PARUN
METWRAAVVRTFGDPERIQVENQAILPQLTSPNQALIRVKCAGVNPVDAYIRSGHYSVLPHLPYTPGREGSGIVEQVGEKVKDFKIGDRVWFTDPLIGSCADYSIADKFYKLNDETSFAEGATLGIKYMTAYRALFLKAHARAGQTVLIHGASGGVGLAACQLAFASSLKVIGTASTVDGRQLVKENGAEFVVDHSKGEYWEELKEAYPSGFDVILEMLANANLEHDFELVANNGCIIVIGSRGTVEVNPRLLMVKEACVRGALLAKSSANEYDFMSAHIGRLLMENAIRPVISKRFPLRQLSAAHRYIIHHIGSHGSVVIDMDLG